MIYLIAALDEKNALGRQGKLLCHLPLDLQYFKQHTLGQAIFMGRKTFESIGRALPRRENFVLTHKKITIFPGCTAVNSIEEALEKKKSEVLWLIGGGEIFKQYLSLVDKAFLSKIHHTFEDADTFFPQFDTKKWRKISEKLYEVSEKNAYSVTFEVYQRYSNSESGSWETLSSKCGVR